MNKYAYDVGYCRSEHVYAAYEPFALLPLCTTPRRRFILESLAVVQLVKKLAAVYGNPSFVTVLTKSRYWILTRVRLIPNFGIRLASRSGLFIPGK